MLERCALTWSFPSSSESSITSGRRIFSLAMRWVSTTIMAIYIEKPSRGVPSAAYTPCKGWIHPLPGANTPVVYVCEANSVVEADLIHRRVWNQNIVPFLLVQCPREIRLYSGFKYKRETIGERRAPGRRAVYCVQPFNSMKSRRYSSLFGREAIDDGVLWHKWNKAVTPEARVDWQLLSSLDRLDQRLLGDGIQSRLLAHALIGKFVYLHYLRARDILSDRKLAEWGLDPDDVLSRRARLDQFQLLLNKLDGWLNGSVFPLSEQALTDIGEERLQQVAGVFRGDTPEGQQHLDFDAYDFSYIPIETLSVIYQQFLHAAEYAPGALRRAGARCLLHASATGKLHPGYTRSSQAA